MLKDILCYKADSLWSHHSLFTVDIPYHLIINIFFYIHCLDVIYTEWKYILVIDGINDSICMELITESLCCGKELRVLGTTCIHREYRCTRKSKQMIFLKFFTIAVCISPNWLLWHSSKIITTCFDILHVPDSS